MVRTYIGEIKNIYIYSYLLLVRASSEENELGISVNRIYLLYVYKVDVRCSMSEWSGVLVG